MILNKNSCHLTTWETENESQRKKTTRKFGFRITKSREIFGVKWGQFRIIDEEGKLWHNLVLLYPYVPAVLKGAQRTDGRYSSETKGDGTETYGGHDLKNLSVFLNVKKGRSQPGNKGLCFVCDCNSGECQRTNAHTAAAAGAAWRRQTGGTGWCLGTRSKNSRILNTLLLPQFWLHFTRLPPRRRRFAAAATPAVDVSPK